MSLIKSGLKYLAFFILGAVVATFVLGTFVSYYAIENLTHNAEIDSASAVPFKNLKKDAKAKDNVREKELALDETDRASLQPWINPNLQELTAIGEQYRQELNLFDQLFEEVNKREPPEICKVVCNPSSLDQDRMKAERSAYLLQYYKDHGKRALQDPQFRLKMEEVRFLSELFPRSFRVIFSAGEQLRGQKSDFLTKLTLALHLEFAALREATTVRQKLQDLKQERREINTLRRIVQSCQRGTMPVKTAVAECESKLIN